MSKESDQKDLIDTIIAEAGGSGLKAMEAVAAAIHNRANARGISPADVVRQKGQFEGYSNPGSASVAAQKLDHVRSLAQQAWDNIQSGRTPDPLNGGTDFRAESAAGGLHAPHGTVNIGGNVFALGKKPSEAEQVIEAVAPLPAPAPLTEGIAYGEPALKNNSVHTVPINPLTGQPITDITVHGGAQSPVLLPSGKTILPGTYPSSDGTHTVTVSDDGTGKAKITHNQQVGEIPGLINPAKELAPGSTSVVGNYLKTFIADHVAPAQAAVASKVIGAGNGLASAGNNLVTDAQGFAEKAAPVAATVGNAAKSIFGIFGGTGAQVPNLVSQNDLGGGSNVPFVSSNHPHANGDFQTLPSSALSSAQSAASMGKLESIHDSNDLRLNPEWTAWNAEQASPTLKKGEMFTSTGGKVSGSQWAAMNYVGDDAYQSPAVLAEAPRAPAPPKYLSVPGGSSSQPQAPVDKVAQLVKLLSGKTVPVGTTGTAQGGAYDFVVQKDGSILNRTTGKITAPAPKQSPTPQPQVQDATSKFLGDRGVSTSNMTIGQQANELNKSLAGRD